MICRLMPNFLAMETPMLRTDSKLCRILCFLLLPLTAGMSVAQTGGFSEPQPAASTANEVTGRDDSGSIRPERSDRHDKDHPLTINSPKSGQTISQKSVPVTLTLQRTLNRDTFRVRLNGKNITTRFSRGQDNRSSWTEVANLSTKDGLRAGKNTLHVSAYSFEKRIELERVSFDYTSGLGDTTAGPYVPPTVGLTVNPGGAQPWVTLTTGTPASLQDNIDTTQYSVPYRDSTFPLSTDTPCSETFQVVVLTRWKPAVEEAYKCFSSVSSMNTYLASLNSNNLVIAGTTPGQNAPDGLNTTSIGGTDYTNTPTSGYPQTYLIIGVPGAQAGSAYENYSVQSTSAAPFQYQAFAGGLLSADVFGNYNFHAGDNRLFTVSPNDINAKTSLINIGGQSYNAPPNSQNGFWLLVVDRMLLQPIDSSTAPGATCPYDAGTTSGCGTFYPTGSSDSTTAANAMADLTAALKAVSPRSLAFLTTVGQPFTSGAGVSADLTQAVVPLGGSRFTLPQLTTPTSTYTLVAPGTLTSRSPFASGIAWSSSVYSQQNQTGYITGVLARDLSSLYAPTVSTQADGMQNAADATSVTLDLSYYQISSQTMRDWPLTDTSGHIAAYHYASSVFMGHRGVTGSHTQDLRYFYTGSPEYGANNTEFLPQSPFYPTYPGSGAAFSEQDLTDACAQLYAELTALYTSNNYFGTDGLRNIMQGSGGDSVSSMVISAAYQVEEGQVGVSPATTVTGDPGSWMNLFAGLAAIPAALLGPLDLPIAAAAFGAASGVLWTGSALSSPFSQETSATPPSDENEFDTTLGQLEQNASTYATNLVISYDTSLDSIYSDWGKLQTIGAKTGDSDSGWQFVDALTVDSVGLQLATGASRSLYLQLLPQFFQLDVYGYVPTTVTIDKLGWYFVGTIYPDGRFYQCTSNYGSVPSNGYHIYPQIGDYSVNDVYVIGGTINYQGTQQVTEALPSSQLLDILFNPPAEGSTAVGNLNFPVDPFYSDFDQNFLMYRTGPNAGQGFCYTAPCYSDKSSNTCQ